VLTFLATPNAVTATAGGLINLTATFQRPPALVASATGTILVVKGPANFSKNTVTIAPGLQQRYAGEHLSADVHSGRREQVIQLHYSGESQLPRCRPADSGHGEQDGSHSERHELQSVCCVVPFTFRVDVIPPGSLFSPTNPTGLFDNTGKLRVCYSPREHRRRRSAGRLCA
jgi:hypothetical protein